MKKTSGDQAKRARVSRLAAKPPAGIRQMKALKDVSSLAVYVITIFNRGPDVLDPDVIVTFEADDAVQGTVEIAWDHWIEQDNDPDAYDLVWRGGEPDFNNINQSCWHLDLVRRDGTQTILDYAILNEVDVTDQVADMDQTILDTIVEIRAEADDIDMIMTRSVGTA